MHDILSLPDLSFPEGFLWGSSTSAYQIEGGNIHNDWHRGEQAGRFSAACGKACNHYELYKEDIDLLKQLGHQVFRLSIEWSRVEPREGDFDAAAIEHYTDVCRRLVEAGIRPWVTLWHFTNPIWFADKGEWHKEENVPCFLRYVERMVAALAPYVDVWLPINEYNFFSGAPNPPADHHRLANYAFNLLFADAGAYDIVKSHRDVPCASPMAYLTLCPRRPHDLFDRTLTDYADWAANGWYYHAIRTGELVYPFTDVRECPRVKGRADFWAVNMYSRDLVDSRAASCRGPRHLHSGLRINRAHADKPWEITPDEILANLMRLKDKPVYVTENGCNTDDDRFRTLYIALHLAAIRQAMDFGLDVRCYLYWSFLDNFEWGSWAPKYGMVGFDTATFERRPKPSAAFFRDVIRANGLSGDLIRKHLPRLPSTTDTESIQ